MVLVCLSTHTQITFKLSFQFYAPVIEEPSLEMSIQGVGIHSAVFAKEKEGVWAYLSQEKKKYPIWEDIAIRYE